MSDLTPRPEVQWFAEQMEAKLRARDGQRGSRGWTGCSERALLDLLEREVSELDLAISNITYLTAPPASSRAKQIEDGIIHVIDECRDVANYAMMIADVARSRLRTKQ